MAELDRDMIAVCGLDCGACPLRLATFDRAAAENLVGWWKSEGWLKEDEGADEVMARAPHCMGCRGDRDKHWSADCELLACCVDDKGLENCSQCAEFECERITAWAAQSDDYAAGVERLRQMRAAAGG